MLKKINRITEKYFKLEHFYNMGETVSLVFWDQHIKFLSTAFLTILADNEIYDFIKVCKM